MMGGRVPLGRRILFEDKRRGALSIVGVGVALVLVLILNGVVDGAMRAVTAYIRDSPADLFVSQRGVRTIHMSQSVLAPTVVDDVSLVEGVAWAEGLRYSGSTLEAPRGRRFTYVFGYDTATSRGGPRHLASGRAPGRGEIVVDKTVADELGVRIGQDVVTLGERFVVSGLATGGTSIANTTVFVRSEDFALLRGDAFAYVLVGGRPGVSSAALAERLGAALPDLTVQTKRGFAAQEAELVRDMAADIMTIMSIVGFLIALAVVALTLFTLTLSKLHEYGVIKAIGASSGRLAATIVSQAALSVAIGLGVALVLAVLIGAAVGAYAPNLTVVLTPASLGRTAVGAFTVGGTAALLPLWRAARVDPATAFRSA